MLKKTKFFIGIALLVQSVTFLVIFIILLIKNKSLWKTFLIIGLAGGVAGTLLVYKTAKDNKKFKAMMDAVDTLCDYDEEYDEEPEHMDIPTDDTATEAEFE